MSMGLRTPNSELPATTLTKREYFAGLVVADMAKELPRDYWDAERKWPDFHKRWAKQAVMCADALIAELAK